MESPGFANLIDKLSSVATLDNWEPLYDKRLDYFYWRKPDMSKSAQMVKVSRETHLYVTPAGRIEGVFVEYLKSNFAAHNTSYKDMVKIFTKHVVDGGYTVSSHDKDTKALFGRFAESLRADIYRDTLQDHGTIADLECAIAQVVTCA